MSGRDYEDMIRMPHPISGTHPRMSARDRAAQFSPCATLTGLEAAISETACLTDDCPELTEDSKALLSDRLRELQDRIDEEPEAEITWFEPDEKKAGGACRTMRGTVREIDVFAQTVRMENGLTIPFEGLIEIRISDPF